MVIEDIKMELPAAGRLRVSSPEELDVTLAVLIREIEKTFRRKMGVKLKKEGGEARR